MMLISLILLRPSSSNKVKILDRSYISKGLSFHHTWVVQITFFAKFTTATDHTLILEQSLIGTLCPPWKQSMLIPLRLALDWLSISFEE